MMRQEKEIKCDLCNEGVVLVTYRSKVARNKETICFACRNEMRIKNIDKFKKL